MAASGRRRGPAPIASFDHDVSDESSPETKQTFRLPEIREDPACSTSNVTTTGGDVTTDGLAPPEQRARSHSSPAVQVHSTAVASGGLQTPAAPRIDISRASSSSHQDSRDSSPELALFAGGGDDARNRLELGFREDGALELRSSTEELAFLEGAPGAPSASGEARSAPPAAPPSRRHSRKDSQGSEAALLGVSGRTSRLSSVGSQCSAHSALSGFSHTSRVSRLSVVSGTSRSPSPHKMLLETSFCGPKPIETDPEICAAAVEERLLEIAKLANEEKPQQPVITTPTSAPPPTPIPVDARDRREVRTEATVESARSRSASVNRVEPVVPPQSTVITTPAQITITQDEDKLQKETKNRARAEERRARSRERREPSQPEVYKTRNRSKDIIRIRLKPDNEYDDDDDESDHTLIGGEPARKPASLELTDSCIKPARIIEPAPISPLSVHRRQRDSRTPSPAGVPVSRKSSFCSLFKSRETIASPDSPSDALRRKKSLNEGRSRSKSRDRSTTPSSAGKMKGSVLSLFKTPRKSATSPSPNSRDVSPVVQPQRQFPPPSIPPPRGEKLKYYEDTKDGIIHIPLRTPPDEIDKKHESEEKIPTRDIIRPASAPQPRSLPERPSSVTPSLPSKPTQRTVLPDGSIIIPLHSPTEKSGECASMSSVEPTPEPGPSISSGEREERTTLERSMDEGSEGSSAEPRSSKITLNDVAPSTAKIDNAESDRPRKKERIIFTTHVGSREQVFSTQFSITKTPSVTSEISESIPSFYENEDVRPSTAAPVLRVTHITTAEMGLEMGCAEKVMEDVVEAASGSAAGTPGDAPRDSSESEPSSEAAPARTGNDVERRGLVVQESFEEELPYVPTTLPQERSVALPMVPVRERGGVRVAGVQRPRAARPPAARPPAPRPPPAAPPPAPEPRIRIQLPRRARAASASGPSRRDRPRTRSGGDRGEARMKSDWIDFEDVPERRKQPKRIQTLPASAASSAVGGADGGGGVGDAGGAVGDGGVMFSYVEPEECRCECHARQDDELPLLNDDGQNLHVSTSSLECEEEARVRVSVHIAPFTADLPLRPATTPDSSRPQ
ncbi:uncharacterized protein [Epargyreus clarus]|uniref:uncharacterized protein isoform X2 n=1 Tax=Epargyreus clarus TaxID=520877 RepID=UPI003C2AC4A5